MTYHQRLQVSFSAIRAMLQRTTIMVIIRVAMYLPGSGLNLDLRT